MRRNMAMSPWWLLVVLFCTDYAVGAGLRPEVDWGWVVLYLALINSSMLAVWWVGVFSQGGTWKRWMGESARRQYRASVGYPMQVLEELNRMVLGLDSGGGVLWANRVGREFLKKSGSSEESFFDVIESASQLCARGRRTGLKDAREVVGLPRCHVLLKEGAGVLHGWAGKVSLLANAGQSDLAYVVDLEREEQLSVADMAMTDDLTGLYNRRFADQKIQGLMDTKLPFVLYFIDLDRFKAVNDTYGHEAGDLVLQEAGRRIKQVVRDSDFAIRMGGDEFNVLIIGELSVGRIQAIGEELVSALNKPMALPGLEVSISASIGVARYPIDGSTTKDLISKADFAMYSAKLAGKNAFLFFDEKHDRALLRRKRLQEGIRAAIDAQEIDVNLVAVLDREHGGVALAEVEARWVHPDLGVIEEVEVLRVAQEFALGQEVGRLLMLKGLSWLQQVHKRERGHRMLKVSIGVVKAQLQSSIFCQELVAQCKDRGLRHSDVVLSVKESVVLSNDAVVLHNLRQLSDQGFALALDDFGMGHSPLTCFYEFKFRYLKLDAKVAAGVHEPKYRKLVQTVRSIADTLEIRVIAKGVESVEDEAELKRLRVELFQGGAYGPSVPLSEFEQDWCVYSTSLVLPENAQLGVADDFFN
mgnify:CR=1 FL=1